MFTETDNKGVGESMREIWQVDSENVKKHFQDDQKKNCEICDRAYEKGP